MLGSQVSPSFPIFPVWLRTTTLKVIEVPTEARVKDLAWPFMIQISLLVKSSLFRRVVGPWHTMSVIYLASLLHLSVPKLHIVSSNWKITIEFHRWHLSIKYSTAKCNWFITYPLIRVTEQMYSPDSAHSVHTPLVPTYLIIDMYMHTCVYILLLQT